MKKRLASTLLVLCMVLTFLPISDVAALDLPSATLTPTDRVIYAGQSTQLTLSSATPIRSVYWRLVSGDGVATLQADPGELPQRLPAMESWNNHRHSSSEGVRNAAVHLPLPGGDLRKGQVIVKGAFLQECVLSVNHSTSVL